MTNEAMTDIEKRAGEILDASDGPATESEHGRGPRYPGEPIPAHPPEWIDKIKPVIADTPPSEHVHEMANPANEVVADNGSLVCIHCGLLARSAHPATEGLDVLRTWRDYWRSIEGTERDPAKMDAALSLMVRQFDAVLSSPEGQSE